jgi:hypothetical protein
MKFIFNLYPEDANDEESWYFCPFIGDGNSLLKGNHLGFLYYALLDHVVN